MQVLLDILRSYFGVIVFRAIKDGLVRSRRLFNGAHTVKEKRETVQSILQDH